MSQTRCRVSIGLPVYNGENYLAEALDSLLGQTFSDFELILCDNASTDGTEGICRAYAARDSRIRYVRHASNLGAAWNFNRTFELSSAGYFKWAAHDDLHAPRFLEACVEVLDHDPGVVLCHCVAGRTDRRGTWIEDYHCPMRADSPRPHERFRDLIWVDHPCTAIFGLIRRDVLRRTPLIAPYVGSDRNLLAELGLLGRFHEIPDRLFLQREHPHRSVAIQERQRLAWFDPALAGRSVFPAWRPLAEYFASVARTPLPPGQRLGCYRSLAALAWHRRRRLWDDLCSLVREVVRPHGPHRPDQIPWQARLETARRQLAEAIPAGQTIVLVDEDQWGTGGAIAGLRALPYIERNGCYWGPPPDDARGVEELLRLRRAGARFVVFAWPAFWWLDYYAHLREYLAAHGRRMLKNDLLIIFELV